jgi:hypothetical protein
MERKGEVRHGLAISNLNTNSSKLEYGNVRKFVALFCTNLYACVQLTNREIILEGVQDRELSRLCRFSTVRLAALTISPISLSVIPNFQ